MLSHAVDYGPAALWITMLRICGLVECGGWLRPHTPQAGLSPARFASCGCSSGAHGGGGDSATGVALFR